MSYIDKELIKTVYVCETDWEIEIGETSDIVIYPSIKSLKKHRQCWKECGIVELEVRKKRSINDGDL
jgi:nickel-dependent lactate racemase